MELRAPGDRDIVIGNPLPNRGTTLLYRQLIDREMQAMMASYTHWVSMAYKRVLAQAQDTGKVSDPERASDARANPKDQTSALFVELKRLDGYWTARVKRFAE